MARRNSGGSNRRPRSNNRRGGKPKGGTAEGIVGIVFEKDYHGDLLYSIKLEDDNTWYRCGAEYPEPLDQEGGDYVRFKWEVDPKNPRSKNALLDTLEVLDDEGEEAEEQAPRRNKRSKSAPAAKRSGKKSKDGMSLKDMRITMLSARNSAIEVVKYMLEHGALELPSKTKVAERHDALIGILDNLTKEFFYETLALTNDDYLAAVEYIDSLSADDSEEEYEEEEEEYEEEVEEEEDDGEYADD